MGKARIIEGAAAVALVALLVSGCGFSIKAGDIHDAGVSEPSRAQPAGGSNDVSGWASFRLADASATAEFPGEPSEVKDTIDLGGGRQVARTRYLYPGDDPQYVVQVLHSSGLPSNQNPAEKYQGDDWLAFLESYAKGIAQTSGGEVANIETGSFLGYPAVKYEMSLSDGDAQALSFSNSGGDIVSLLTQNASPADMKRFMESYTEL